MPTTRQSSRTRTGVRVGWTLIRKTSLLQDHSDDERGQASADMNCAARNDHLAMTITIRSHWRIARPLPAETRQVTATRERSERSPLHDVRQLAHVSDISLAEA
jgi:hypothetical protein